jgi:DNA replication protein DnaC
MHIEQVISQMKSLRLSAMAESLAEHIRKGDLREFSPDEFVSLLVQDEYTARQNRKLVRMIGRANLKPQQACLENVKFDKARGFTKKDLAIFTTPAWITDARNVIITGATGTGKSYLSEAIGLSACRHGYPVLKYRCSLLFEEIQSAKGTGTYIKMLKKLSKAPVLIIDDFLMQSFTSQDATSLLEIVEEKQMTGSIIVTSQFAVNKWHAKMPDPTIADAICDRIIHTAYKFSLEGESMRKQKSQDN